MDILEEIIAHKRLEVFQLKGQAPKNDTRKEVERVLDYPIKSLREAIMQSDTGIIAEFKRRSPSKGWIKEEGKAAEIPLSYQQNGAAALSILTDTKYFGGDDSFVMEARESGVTLPILYKNFIIDECQLFQARLCGASAVLLIAACLSIADYRKLLASAHDIGLEVVLEIHCTRELDYIESAIPDVCGVNNRNLGTFKTDVQNSFDLASRLPSGVCRISESGISSPVVIRALRDEGFNGFLIGETFMRTDSPGATLHEFIEKLRNHED